MTAFQTGLFYPVASISKDKVFFEESAGVANTLRQMYKNNWIKLRFYGTNWLEKRSTAAEMRLIDTVSDIFQNGLCIFSLSGILGISFIF